MLSIDQKRRVTFEWFMSPETRIKDLDRFRRFVRIAAKDLDLRTLRKLRFQADCDEKKRIDENALALINSYHPVQRIAAVVEKRDTVRKEPNKKKTSSDFRALLIAFFDDIEMTPLALFLRKNGAMGRKKDIFAAVSSIQLRRLRQRREESGIRSIAMAKIDEIFTSRGNWSGGKCGEEKDSCKRTTRDHHRSDRKNVVGHAKATDTAVNRVAFKHELKPILIDWFDHPEKSIISILAENDLIEEKHSMRMAVMTIGLRKMRNNVARDEAIQAIDTLFPDCNEHSSNFNEESFVTDGHLWIDHENQLKKDGLATSERNNLKQLLIEWFYEENRVSIAEFCKMKNLDPDMRPTMSRLINNIGLRKLRNDHRAISLLVSKRIENFSRKDLHNSSGEKFAKKTRTKSNNVNTNDTHVVNSSVSTVMNEKSKVVYENVNDGTEQDLCIVNKDMIVDVESIPMDIINAKTDENNELAYDDNNIDPKEDLFIVTNDMVVDVNADGDDK